MKKLVAVLIGIIVVLIITLCTVTVLYLKQRDLIYEYMGNYDFSFGSDTNSNTLE